MTELKPEPKRIAKLRREIVRAIPRFPNDKSSKERLERESLGGLLVHYLSWQLRFVVPRPRTVHVEDTASTDPRWITLAPEITVLLDKVRRGEDLTPHLSLAAWTEGYTPAASGQGPGVDRWADKDFLLNVMGFHHFHLNSTLEKRGFITRSKDVLFASVSRTRFDVIGIFDHSVFDDDDPLAMPA